MRTKTVKVKTTEKKFDERPKTNKDSDITKQK